MRKENELNASLSDIIQEFGNDQPHVEPNKLEQRLLDKSSTHSAAKLNILLSGEDAGIQLANRLADKLNIPFVLINTNERNHSTAEASITIPEQYLNSSFEQAVNSLSKTLLKRSEEDVATNDEVKESFSPQVEGSLFIKDNSNFIKISFEQIDFVKSDGNYIEIHWANRVSVLKKTMKSFEEKASHHAFHQVHRSYLINLNKITRIGPAHVYLDKYKIPLSKGKKEQLLEMLDTF